jgi:hypothetical protein
MIAMTTRSSIKVNAPRREKGIAVREAAFARKDVCFIWFAMDNRVSMMLARR